VPSRSVNILVGDSGLGKSPLVYQLGISVATGVPFLGRETRKGRVVIADNENGPEDMNDETFPCDSSAASTRPHCPEEIAGDGTGNEKDDDQCRKNSVHADTLQPGVFYLRVSKVTPGSSSDE